MIDQYTSAILGFDKIEEVAINDKCNTFHTDDDKYAHSEERS